MNKKLVMTTFGIIGSVFLSCCGDLYSKTTTNATQETARDTVLEQITPTTSSKTDNQSNSTSNETTSLSRETETIENQQKEIQTHGNSSFASRYKLTDTQLNEAFCRRITAVVDDGSITERKIFEYTNVLEQELISINGNFCSYSYEGTYNSDGIINGTITHLNLLSSSQSIYNGTKTTFVILDDGKIEETRLLGLLEYGDVLETVTIQRNPLGLIEKFTSVDNANDNRVTEYVSSFSQVDNIIIEHRKNSKETFLFIYLLDENNRVLAGCSDGAFWVNYYDDDGFDAINNCTSVEEVYDVLIPIWDRDKEEYEIMFEKAKKIYDTYR